MGEKPYWAIVVKVWLLPPNMGEAALRSLHKDIVKAVTGYLDEVKTEEDFLTLFPPDLMSYGNDGSEIYIELIKTNGSGVGNKQAWCTLCEVVRAVRKTFPDANIQGSVLEAADIFN